MVKYFASFKGIYKGSWDIFKADMKKSKIHTSQLEYKGMSVDKEKCFDSLEDCIKSIPNYDNYKIVE
jgi:hypothetical protein